MAKRAKVGPRHNRLFLRLAALPTHCLTSLHFLKILYFVSTFQILDLNVRHQMLLIVLRRLTRNREYNLKAAKLLFDLLFFTFCLLPWKRSRGFAQNLLCSENPHISIFRIDVMFLLFVPNAYQHRKWTALGLEGALLCSISPRINCAGFSNEKNASVRLPFLPIWVSLQIQN